MVVGLCLLAGRLRSVWPPLRPSAYPDLHPQSITYSHGYADSNLQSHPHSHFYVHCHSLAHRHAYVDGDHNGHASSNRHRYPDALQSAISAGDPARAASVL